MKDAFDDIAKAFASRMSRRDALRRAAIATAGALFAFGPARARAASAGKGAAADCKAFCSFLYKPWTQGYKDCVTAAKQGLGACYDVGPRSKACKEARCPKHSICMSTSVNFNFTAIHDDDYLCVPLEAG